MESAQNRGYFAPQGWLPTPGRRCCTARSKSLTSLCRLQSHPAQYVSGIPSAAILLSISHPIRCSTRCLANVRARISGPMSALYWRAMETEELGSVYESLLELQPQLTNDGRALVFASDVSEQKGNQRKTTGSYYTPDSLVQALLDTALDPVLDRIEAEAKDPAKTLLRLSVIDPACGSGHFLLAAARRIATRLARIRAEGTPSLTDFRHALRDVARCCIHGVDRNPMAVELTKVALWIETVDPGLPLGFFDAQVRCGDALLGIFDLKVLEDGIPDAAYKPLTGEALLHGSEQIADLPVPVAESPGAVRIGHPERGHLVEYLAPNSVFNSLPRQRSSPHLRPDDRLVTIDRVFHHASLGAA